MKKFVITALLAIFAFSAIAQDSTNPTRKNDGLARWSLGIKGGADMYRVTPFTNAESPDGKKYTRFEQRMNAISWNGNFFLEYNPNPVFGIGLNCGLSNYDRNAKDGEEYKFYGQTMDAILYNSINISNLVSPQRIGGWKKISFYAGSGVGTGFYSYKQTTSLDPSFVEGAPGFNEYSDKNVSLILMANAGLDFSLAPWVSFMLEGEYRYYNMDDLGGISSASNGNDAFFANAGFRFKLGGKRNVRNMTYDEYYKPTGIYDRLAAMEQENIAMKKELTDRIAAVEKDNADIKRDLNEVKKDVEGIKGDVKYIKNAIEKMNQKEVVQKVTATAENIEFMSGKAVLTEESKQLLDEVALLLSSIEWTKLDIAGHTDNVGNAAKNKQLSQDRADTVKGYLVDKGLDANKMTSVGYGPERPIASNNTEAGRQRNRRVEFAIK